MLCQIDNKDLLDNFLQTNKLLSVTSQIMGPMNMRYFKQIHAEYKHLSIVMDVRYMLLEIAYHTVG